MSAWHRTIRKSRWPVLISMAIVSLTLLPQIYLWVRQGHEWNGTYATVQGDEFLYSAYVNSLVNGRSRRNDPFAGRDSNAVAPLPESTFSIQFVPAYSLSIVGRVFGISTSTVFILLSGIAGLFLTWCVFGLLSAVLKDQRVALAATVVVLCLAELAGDGGMVGVLLFHHKLSVLMPFLRRYQPAFPLPVYFLFCGLVWRSVLRAQKQEQRHAYAYAVAAGLLLATLMFSYLYLWTAAAAWLACIAALWTIFYWHERKWRVLSALAIPAGMMMVTLIPYTYLVARRSHSLDDAQILVMTRHLDLLHSPEIIGFLVIVSLVTVTRRRGIKWTDQRVLFTTSFATLPFLLFNQQLITGRSMQPFHFDLFVANYVAVVAAACLTALIWPKISTRALFWIAALAFTWALLEVGLLAKARSVHDASDDQIVPVLRHLNELSHTDGTLAGLRDRGKVGALVFSPHVDVMRTLPTWSNQGTLLAAGAQDFGTATRLERKQMLYQQLYYSGVDMRGFRDLLNQNSNDPYLNFFVPSVVFGDERFIPELSIQSQPIRPEEIEPQVVEYDHYVQSFSKTDASRQPLTYLITRQDERPEALTRFDRWYERDAGEQFGRYVLYRVRLRD
jgi:hypothetical protein